MRAFKTFFSVGLALAGTAQFLVAAPDDLVSPKLSSTDADAAWKELHAAMSPPPAPEAWHTTKPTQEERNKLFVPFLTAGQGKAKDFYTRFPADEHEIGARELEMQMTQYLIQIGVTNQQARAEEEEKGLLGDPHLPPADRFQIRRSQVERTAEAKRSEGNDAVMAEFEKGTRVLQKEFTNNVGTAEMLFVIARNSEPAKAREVLQEITKNYVDEQLIFEASSQLKQLESVGMPLGIHFTAVDGSDVDIAKLKGKVVLVDFWATWCPPCVREVPNVKATYDKLHSQGFEIVGISLDDNKTKLNDFVKSHDMEWPQYFDGLHWQNKFVQQYKIMAVPAMWLVDKKGVLLDIYGIAGLDRKVTKLLAE
jgi:thiol-disulfide isomerase/thioredoxin